MKTKRSMTRWLTPILACGALSLVVPAPGAESLNFTRLASWPGYEMGSVLGLYPTGSVVWVGMDCSSVGSLLALDVSNSTSAVVLSSTPIRGGVAWAFDNGFAYALSAPSSSSSYVEVYDLADAHHPVLRGGTSITPVGVGGWGTSMMVHQGYLWIFSEQGVEIYDVRNPSAPQRAGGKLWDTSQRPSQPVRVGDFGVVMTTDPAANSEYALRVFDLTKPAQPAETDVMPYNIGNIGSWPFLVLTTLGDYVYYLTGSPIAGEYNASYLHAVRITELGMIEPTAVALRLTVGGNNQMCSVGDYLYYGGAAYSQPTTYWLRLVDVTSRAEPKLLTSPVINTPTFFRNLMSYEGRVFMSLAGGAQGLFVLNATNAAQPSVAGTLWRTWKGLYGFVGGSDEPIWRVRDDGSSRIRLHGAAGLLAGNAAPYKEWNLPFVPNQGDNKDVAQVLLHSNYCYVMSSGIVYYPSSACWLDVYDVSGNATPVLKSSRQLFQQDDSWGLGGMYHTAKIDGDELFVTYWPGVMDIHSLTNPVSPQLLGTVSVDLPDDLQIHNGYAYLFTATGNNSAGSIRRLEVVDVRDPANPSAMSICREWTGVWHGAMAADGSLLYVMYFKNGFPNAIALDIFDLTDPLSPTRLSSTVVTSTEYSAYDDIAISKPYAFLVGEGLLVVDVSNPAQPKTLGKYNPFPQIPGYTSGRATQVKTWQNHVVIQQEPIGMVVLDVRQVLSALSYQPWWGGTLRLSWEGVPGIILQRASSIHPGAQWEIVPNTDGQSQAIVPLSSPQAFFRLARP